MSTDIYEAAEIYESEKKELEEFKAWLNSLERTESDSGTEKPLTEALTDILRLLRKSPRTVIQVEVAAACERSLRSVVDDFKKLRERGLIHHPNGRRSGATLTSKGRRIAQLL